MRNLQILSLSFLRQLFHHKHPHRFANMGCSSSKSQVSRSNSAETMGNKPQQDEFVENVVCDEDDVAENEMKTFDMDSVGKILLVKQDGVFSALGTKCTHAGAPLVNSALGKGRLRCQWHGACFNLKTGDIEEFPGLDSLPCYQVTVQDKKVKVRARRADLESNKRQKVMTPRQLSIPEHVVVIGGGPSGATCVEVLRQEGFQGRITLLCRENCLPYDRVKVSKEIDFDIAKAEFRTDQFYKDHQIDVLKGISASSLDAKNKTVALSNGNSLNYDKAYIATGLTAVKAPIPGADLGNVYVLRDYEHSRKVNAQLGQDRHVVVLGSSFVAMEAANFCLGKVASVTVVARGPLPFQPLLGDAIGHAVKQLFEEKGVVMVMNSGMVRCYGDDKGNVNEVELVDGRKLPAHIVIMGVGSRCNTDFLTDSGIDIRQDGSIETNAFLETNVEGVFVGGDIAHAPVWSYDNKKVTIGHYPLAQYHGKIAALNILGKKTELRAVPYFWTRIFGKGIRYSGHGAYDDIVHIGDVSSHKYLAFYLKGDRVLAASSCNMDPEVSRFAEELAQGKKLTREDLRAIETRLTANKA